MRVVLNPVSDDEINETLVLETDYVSFSNCLVTEMDCIKVSDSNVATVATVVYTAPEDIRVFTVLLNPVFGYDYSSSLESGVLVLSDFICIEYAEYQPLEVILQLLNNSDEEKVYRTQWIDIVKDAIKKADGESDSEEGTACTVGDGTVNPIGGYAD